MAHHENARVAVIGGGPAGLMAAEVLAGGGAQVDLYDAMPSIGRKFLLAGKGGLNLTHAEPAALFMQRYGGRNPQLQASLGQFGADAVRAWAAGLGIETFVGSSSRVFPLEKKAAPLLRAWQKRLRDARVSFHLRHRWTGWDNDAALLFTTPTGVVKLRPEAIVLALGGASWARLGSDGAWVPWLASRQIAVAPLKPANCGFDLVWSEHFGTRFRRMLEESAAGFCCCSFLPCRSHLLFPIRCSPFPCTPRPSACWSPISTAAALLRTCTAPGRYCPRTNAP